LQNGRVVYTIKKNLKSIERLNKSNINETVVSDPVLFIEDSKIAMYINNEKRILQPLGKGNYIWPSLSPDKTKLLFTLAGTGTFVSDLQGNIIAELGYANAPVWSPKGKWICYMEDRDNGMNVTSSNLFLISADGREKIQLTNSEDVHEMYPQFSPSGNEIVFNSSEGNIYLMKLNISE
jgi:Tol biopolymer transport system component